MGESSNRYQPSRLGVLKPTIGEIVEVQGGGRILRSIGRKDRHSKVCTARGPRDRRVRLAAHTAIQFYDVQDRLGYDRPSKAVDWLIKKAKAAIDELDRLPRATVTDGFEPGDDGARKKLQQDNFDVSNSSLVGESDQNNENRRAQNSNSSFLPPSLDSDVIADTIKSFFPIEAANSSALQFQSFPTPDLRNGNQDLKLSLQMFRDPTVFHNQSEPQSQVLLSGIPLGFDSNTTWSEQSGEVSRYQGLSAWNYGGDGAIGGAPVHQSAGHLSNSPLLQQLLGRNQFFSQRGSLQSSNTPSIRTWMDPSMAEHSQQQHPYNNNSLYPSSGITSSGLGGFSVPVRIQGDDEVEHDGYSDKPSSASSNSRH